MQKKVTSLLAERLLDWYEINAKDYPFRKTSDPYRILVCEILLRKTTARQVSCVYQKFFARFPTVENLASASVQEILEVIRPLGIRRRSYDLRMLAREVVLKHEGRVPDDLSALTSMMGVGRYAASCVLSFAYGRNLPMVDSNVERVNCRLVGLRASSRGSPKEEVWQAYSKIAPASKLREFHQALIDLAHEICRPRDPKCDICPLRSFCSYATSPRTDEPSR